MTVQPSLITALAAGSAWSLAQLFDVDPVLAAILAALTLRASVHATVAGSVTQVLGTGVGAVTALIAETYIDLPVAVLVAAVIFIDLLAAAALKLPGDAVAAVVVTSLIVIGAGGSGTTAEQRLLGTAVGVLVAVIFSTVALGSTPSSRASVAISKLEHAAADLLREIADGAHKCSAVDAAAWLQKARRLSAEVPDVRSQAAEARAWAAWFPGASRYRARRVWEQFVAVEHTIVQVRTIARTLVDITEFGPLPTELSHALHDAFLVTGDGMINHADAVAHDPEAVLSTGQLQAIRISQDGLASAVGQLPPMTDQRLSWSAAAILTNLDRITAALRHQSPASRIPNVGDTLPIPVTVAAQITSPVRKGGLTLRRQWRRWWRRLHQLPRGRR